MSLELKELSCFDSWEKSQLHLSEGHLIYYHLMGEASVMARIKLLLLLYFRLVHAL